MTQMSSVNLNQATIQGRSHRLRQQNCQDFAVVRSPRPDVAVGLVADGCGSKYRTETAVWPSRNEIGAALLTRFAADFLCSALMDAQQPAKPAVMDEVLEDLYSASLRFLEGLLDLYPAPSDAYRRQFVATYLLCTLVGFVRTPATAVFFWLGDGYLCINGHVINLLSNNQPDYLAYRLLSETAAGRPQHFHTLMLLHPHQINWLAVASDGWQGTQLADLVQPQSELALQRRLNVQARQQPYFEDDGAIAIYHKQAHHNDDKQHHATDLHSQQAVPS